MTSHTNVDEVFFVGWVWVRFMIVKFEMGVHFLGTCAGLKSGEDTASKLSQRISFLSSGYANARLIAKLICVILSCY